MTLNFLNTSDKTLVFEQTAEYLHEKNLRISKQDDSRPWGGFFVIEEDEAEKFINIFFPMLSPGELAISGKLSPKILIVAPGKRLSWQYHHRRAEIWKQIGGIAGVVTSDTNEEKAIRHMKIGDVIQLSQGERHRLIGLESWGILAEIWRHTDAENPSNEDDIIRVQDDFGR